MWNYWQPCHLLPYSSLLFLAFQTSTTFCFPSILLLLLLQFPLPLLLRPPLPLLLLPLLLILLLPRLLLLLLLLYPILPTLPPLLSHSPSLSLTQVYTPPPAADGGPHPHYCTVLFWRERACVCKCVRAGVGQHPRPAIPTITFFEPLLFRAAKGDPRTIVRARISL